MADREKRAWFELGVILVTLAVYFAFISFGKLDPVSLAIFAIAGFLGFRRRRRRPKEIIYDERDGQIDRQALLSSLIGFYLFMVVLSIAGMMSEGWWHKPVPIWMAVQAFWVLNLATWAVKNIIVIALYRRSSHA